jgi:hypothetical protein
MGEDRFIFMGGVKLERLSLRLPCKRGGIDPGPLPDARRLGGWVPYVRGGKPKLFSLDAAAEAEGMLTRSAQPKTN